MFNGWLKMAIPLGIVGVIFASLCDGPEAGIPLIIVGGVVYALYHVASGFSSADK